LDAVQACPEFNVPQFEPAPALTQEAISFPFAVPILEKGEEPFAMLPLAYQMMHRTAPGAAGPACQS
jgi:hypothetical protein